MSPIDHKRPIRMAQGRLTMLRLVLVGCLLAVSLLLPETSGVSASGVAGNLSGPDVEGPFIGQTVTAVERKIDLRQLPAPVPDKKPKKHVTKKMPPGQASKLSPDERADAQTVMGAAAMPGTLQDFAGLDFANFGSGWPPDTNGDVGPTYYIQMVNTSIGIYDKTSGSRVAAFTFDDFWGTPGTVCDNNHQGDPIVLYDPLADRWLLSDFSWVDINNGPFYECMAVSKTGDPVTGGWYLYAYQTDPGSYFSDYPKFGVWPDAYYMSANVFNGNSYAGVRVWAFDKATMQAGGPLNGVRFNVSSAYGSLLPSNLRGAPPPAGSPNFFTSINAPNTLHIWKFHVDWSNPANSIFTGPVNLTVAGFSEPSANIPQPGTTVTLDTLGDRLMMQLQYRNRGGIESLWVNHTVTSNGVTGVRWYEVRDPNGSPVIYQQSTYQPDSLYRWMGSVAADAAGNMAAGYSVSSSSIYPSIRYAGRLVTDTLNTLSQAEQSIIEGGGSQNNSFTGNQPNDRWGDYSALTVDPVDDCTFWYTNEYYATSGSNWQTRIGSFRFPSCVNPNGVLQGTVRDNSNNNPIGGALVKAGPYQTTSNGSGQYSFPYLPAGTYTVVASASGYLSGTVSGVSVATGAPATQNFSLTVAPPATVTGSVTDGSGHGWPLYAKLSISGGTPQTVYTDPASGQYSVTLPSGAPYTFQVNTATGSGYLTATRVIVPPAGSSSQNFSLNVDPALCSAPGYTATQAYLQNFESSNGSYSGSGTNTTWAWGTPSTGPKSAHSGTKAWATKLNGSYSNNESSYLTSPQIDLSGYAGSSAQLTWWQWLQTEANSDLADLEVSSNDGASWTTIYGPVSGDVNIAGWAKQSIVLDPAYSVAGFRLRYHLNSDPSITQPGWYVDDISLGGCQPLAGGLLVGNVYDAGSGSGLNGATITSSGLPTQTATTIATPNDPALDDGFYILFSSLTGSQTFSASKTGYTSSNQAVNVPVNGTVRQNFQLSTPGYNLTLNPLVAARTGAPGSVVTYTLTVTNSGNAGDSFSVTKGSSSFGTVVAPTALGPLAPNAAARVIVSVTVPPGVLAGSSDSVAITVRSLGDTNKAATATLTTSAGAVYGLAVTPPTGGKSGLPGTVVNYTLVVSNSGNTADSFAITTAGSFTTSADKPSTGSLAPGAGSTVAVSVTIPGNAAAGTLATSVVTFTSQGDPSKVATATLNTSVVSQAVHGVQLAPSSSARTGVPGQVVSYTLTLTNSGNISDGFTVQITGNAWNTSVTPQPPITLNAGTSRTIIVSVAIPAGSPASTFDTATITLASQADPSQKATATITTSFYRVLLPDALRNSGAGW